MVNKISIKLLLVCVFCILAVSVCLYLTGEVNYAYAEETVSVKSIQGKVLGAYNEPVIIDNPSGYASETTVVFTVSTPYYKLNYSINANSVIEGKVYLVEGDVEFIADQTGEYTLICYAYESEDASDYVGSQTVVFKNDADAPIASYDVVSEMTSWKKTGEEYVACADFGGLSDAVSGIGLIKYYLQGEQAYVLDPNRELKVSLTISEKTKLHVICYDLAGNGTEISYDLDKFDDDAPPMPNYDVTPSYSDGVYAKEFRISLSFLADNGGSGLRAKQYYSINNVIKEFDGEGTTPEDIVLTKPESSQINGYEYTVKLFSTDNAGNKSEEITINIPYSAFDTRPAEVRNMERTFDLRDSDGICRISLTVSDYGESGIDSVKTSDGKIVFNQSAGTLVGENVGYYAKFDCYGYNALTVVITDNVGNITNYPIQIPYFSNVTISETVRKCAEKLHNINLDEYSASAKTQIEKEEAELVFLLKKDDSAENEIVDLAKSLLSVLEGKAEYSYKISSASEYVSTNISFSLENSDFAIYGKGSVVEITISSITSDENYASVAGFKKGFSDFFSLSVQVNGASIENPLTTGILVEMARPKNYFDRNLAIVDLNTGSVVESEVKNDKIYFTIKGSGSYALVIEGGKAVTQNVSSEKITVFGNEMDLSTFLWVVCGTSAVAIILVAVCLIIKKVRG